MSLVYDARRGLRQPPWADPVELHFGRAVSPKISCMLVSRGRPPGGVLLRRKRLIKKHSKWVKAERERLERTSRGATQAVNDLLEKRLCETSFIRSVLAQEVVDDRDG